MIGDNALVMFDPHCHRVMAKAVHDLANAVKGEFCSACCSEGMENDVVSAYMVSCFPELLLECGR